ncbi:Ark- serine/threonine protein kinase [Didymosphaeria variabile]|uniref:Ark- serine/threonine protein kinase n=1 Tax=Didymosphaeria variabile TaxID=1932322 RepID=A0A9W9CH11_9PLEO|nr:Ark- serine/threonine protein kinase [Didymosphaeria variabile]KAJ4361071.1 Ark- serine/threonine protein kinase [Didymosphaeria variabile]
MDLGVSLDRAKSAQSNRPNSIHVASNLDFLREREAAPGRNFDAPSLGRGGQSPAVLDSDSDDEKNITSNIDYLRARENEDSHQKKHRRSSSQNTKGGGKRSSLHSLTSGTKNIVKGRFGDAFKMFESNSGSGPDRGRSDSGPRTPTDLPIDSRHSALTPIAGSEATGGHSDDERVIDETEDLPPEVRRELERRRLSQEERRVEAAAAEYRKRLAEEGKGKAGPTRASTIQNRVRNLLDESQKPVSASRTAEGYGKYTSTGKPLPQRPQDQSGARQPPAVAKKPITVSQQVQQNAPSDLAYTKPRQPPHVAQVPTSASAPPAATRVPTGGPRPPPPSKPTKLRTGNTGDFSTGSRQSPTKSSVRDKPLPRVGGQHDGPADDAWDVDSFSKRYPSLNKLEMVETEIPTGRRDVRDV